MNPSNSSADPGNSFSSTNLSRPSSASTAQHSEYFFNSEQDTFNEHALFEDQAYYMEGQETSLLPRVLDAGHQEAHVSFRATEFSEYYSSFL